VDPEARKFSKSKPSASPREQSGAVAHVNAHADSRLLSRFAASGFPTMQKMMDGHEAQIPKHGGKDVCLVWALRGQCSTSCKRKDAHVRYPKGVVQKLHEFMDSCGVANDQP